MKTLLRLLPLSILFSLMLASIKVYSQDGDMKMLGPGPEHEILKRFDGTWTTKMTMRFDPQTEAMNTTSTDHCKVFYNSMYVKLQSESNIMGQHVRSEEIIGYNRVSEKYTFVRIDDASSAISYAEGIYDPKKDAIEFEGTDYVPGMDGKPKPITYKLLYEFKGEGKYLFTLFYPDKNGKLFPAIKGTSIKNM